MSPEILKCIKNQDMNSLNNIDRFKNDVFCLGMTIIELGILKSLTKVVTKDHIFDTSQLQKYFEQFKNEYKNNKLLISLVQKMIEVNPISRPTFVGNQSN